MSRQGKFVVAALVALGVAGGSAGAWAAAAVNKDAVVKERQDLMKAFAADTKAIGDYAKGAATKDDAQKAADHLAANAMKVVALFPAGTSMEDMPGKSNAKAAIWTDMAKFNAVPTALKDEATKMSALIKTGSPADVAAGNTIGRNGCGACHGSFRFTPPAPGAAPAPAR